MASFRKKQQVIEINKAIVALGRERKLAEALEKFAEMRRRELKPTEVTYNVLINTLTKCGDNVGAMKLLLQMREEGRPPSVITYTTVLKGLTLCGELGRAEELLDQAAQHKVQPNLRTCTAFLRGCLVWGEAARVPPLLERMRGWALTPDGAALEYAVRSLAMSLCIKQAELLLKGSSADTSATDTSAAVHLSLAVAHCTLGSWAQAAARLHHAKARLADGSETRLHSERHSEKEVDERANDRFSGYLEHRRDELEREARRLGELIERQAPAEQPAEQLAEQPAEQPKSRNKRQKVAQQPAHGTLMVADCSAALLRKHLRQMEALFGRVLLVSSATARLAAQPLEEADKPLRRAKLAALLMTRLDRLGLSELVRHCSCGESAKIAKSEQRLFKQAKRACNASGELRWPQIFGNEKPVVLEVCAGAGEWAAAQARKRPEHNIVASEIRGDRIHQIMNRMHSEELPNLALLGGDAAIALRQHTRRGALEELWLNYPEPPADHGDSEAYLLNAPFFRDAHRALRKGGSLLVVSDNLSLMEVVAETLLCEMRGDTHGAKAKGGAKGEGDDEGKTPLRFEPATGERSGASRLSGRVSVAGAALIAEGLPSGFGVAASYFDRLWSSRAKERRFHIRLTRD